MENPISKESIDIALPIIFKETLELVKYFVELKEDTNYRESSFKHVKLQISIRLIKQNLSTEQLIKLESILTGIFSLLLLGLSVTEQLYSDLENFFNSINCNEIIEDETTKELVKEFKNKLNRKAFVNKKSQSDIDKEDLLNSYLSNGNFRTFTSNLTNEEKQKTINEIKDLIDYIFEDLIPLLSNSEEFSPFKISTYDISLFINYLNSQIEVNSKYLDLVLITLLNIDIQFLPDENQAHQISNATAIIYKIRRLSDCLRLLCKYKNFIVRDDNPIQDTSPNINILDETKINISLQEISLENIKKIIQRKTETENQIEVSSETIEALALAILDELQQTEIYNEIAKTLESNGFFKNLRLIERMFVYFEEIIRITEKYYPSTNSNLN